MRAPVGGKRMMCRGAERWSASAEAMRWRVEQRYWMEDAGFYGIAIDGDGALCTPQASNVGHLMFSGLPSADRAARVTRRLLSDDFNSGWGLRTLASGTARFNPMSYHNGSVWPHDNAICAAGLMRYGYVEHAQRVAEAVLDTAEHFGYRLPELFCGFSQQDFGTPVPYPTSCSPQAWAAAAPLLMVHTLLRFAPEMPASKLWCAPALPERYLPMRVGGLSLGKSRAAVDLWQSGWEITGLEATSIASSKVTRPALTWPNSAWSKVCMP